MINGIETEAGITEVERNKLGTLNIFKYSNSCDSCSLITFTT
jgi:hypothetical protein